MYKTFQEEARNSRWNIHGMQVIRNDKVVYQMGDCTTRFPIYSATKSITSLAVGIAVDEGKMSIDKSLYEYIKMIIPQTIKNSRIDILKKISIKRLLTMSIPGLPFRPQGDNWLEYAINYLPENIEKSLFHYSNIPAYLAGVAVGCATGEHVISYLKNRLFHPLNIVAPCFQNCPSGYFYGASGMKLSVEELGGIGTLCLHRGIYDGKRIISEKWLKDATNIQIDCKEGGYGFYFWKFRKGYYISGKWGQRCIVVPSKRLLITYLSDMKNGCDEVTRAVEKYFIY